MTFFAPASVTTFFSPQYSENPLKTGSLGVGITLEKGVKVKINPDTDRIRVNSKDFRFNTIEVLLERLSFRKGLEIEAEIPIGCGFGFSGASCLASAFEINKMESLGMSRLELADLVHECEVLSSTGLGDVVCQFYGGVILRKRAGAPSIVEVERIFFKNELSFLVLGPISTKEILNDNEIIEKIRKYGQEATAKFSMKPSLESLFKLSMDFAIKTGLLDDEIHEIINEIEREGYLASMVMLGKAVFSTCPRKLLEEYGDAFSSKVSQVGVCEVG
jgi:pantoate kinase